MEQEPSGEQMEFDQHDDHGLSGDSLASFVSTGRTGRRNAVADALIDPNRSLTTSSLSDMFVKVECKDHDDSDDRK
jgi:hypothetical protein